MYAVSEAYKTAIASGAPTTRMTGTITLADASTISITDSLLVMGSVSFQEQAVESDEIMLGTCWATEFDCELKTNANLAGAKIEPIFGLQVDGPITNLITNPDFADGTTGWTPLGCTLSALNNILTATATGVTQWVQPYQQTTTPAVNGHKIYVGAYITFNQDVTSGSLMLNAGATQTVKSIPNPGGNRTLLSGIVTLAGQTGGNLKLYISANYVSAAASSGKVHKVEKVVAIDLTEEFGAGNEPATAAEMDAIVASLGGCWEGTITSPDVPKVYEDVPLGTFYVADIERVSSGAVRVVCADAMLKLDIPVGTAPATGDAWDYLSYIATTAGITLEQNEATIAAMPNGTYTITYPAQSEITTLHILLKYIVQLLGGFACFNRDGKLEVRHFTGASVRTLTEAGRENTRISDEQKTVSGVQITLNGTKHNAATVPDLGYTIILHDNPLIRGESAANVATILAAILAEVDGIAYYPATFNWRRNDPAIEIGDNITLSGGVAGAGMGTLVMNNYWKFRGVQNVAAVGHGLVARASQSMAENRLQMKADIAYILEIWAARINAGEKVTIGDPTGERTEIYLDSTNGDRPTIDMYNTAGVLQSRWHYGGFDFFDALGAIATRLATTTEDKTITVGSGKNYATIQEAVNSLPMLIRHDIIIEVYAGAYAETVLIEGFIGPGTISVQNHTGDTVNVVSFSVTSCSLYLLSIKGFTVTKTTGHAVKIYGSNFVSCDTLAITDSAAFYAGIYFYRGCRGLITGCTVSNHGEAISIQNSCDVTITSCAGSGNDVGIHVHSSSAHDGGSNTITGTTPRRTESGGEIIPSTGLIGSSHGGSYVPAGAVMEFAGSTAPTGYKLCDGSAISRTTYADLYAVIGTTYGTGDGSTTFNLPNLKGRIPVGYNGAETEFNALGETGGAKTHTLSNDELPVLYLNGGYVDSDFGLAGARNGIVVTQAAANGFPITTNVNTGGGGGEHNNLQPYIVLNYIIKL